MSGPTLLRRSSITSGRLRLFVLPCLCVYDYSTLSVLYYRQPSALPLHLLIPTESSNTVPVDLPPSLVVVEPFESSGTWKTRVPEEYCLFRRQKETR